MIQFNNSKYQLKLAYNPMTPVFMGSWHNKSKAKWHGIAADLVFNSYLRNG